MKMQPKIDQQSTKNRPKILQKTIKNPPKMDLGGLLGPLGLSGRLPRVPRARPGRGLGRLGGVLVANMAPTWLPKRSQNRVKIEAKIDQNFDASWDRIFEGFWWILEAKWRHVGLQNRILNQALRKCGKSHLELAR